MPRIFIVSLLALILTSCDAVRSESDKEDRTELEKDRLVYEIQRDILGRNSECIKKSVDGTDTQSRLESLPLAASFCRVSARQYEGFDLLRKYSAIPSQLRIREEDRGFCINLNVDCND
jgi:hypothetical protein